MLCGWKYLALDRKWPQAASGREVWVERGLHTQRNTLRARNTLSRVVLMSEAQQRAAGLVGHAPGLPWLCRSSMIGTVGFRLEATTQMKLKFEFFETPAKVPKGAGASTLCKRRLGEE